MTRHWRRLPRWMQRGLLAGLLVGFACAAWGFGWEPRTLVEREYALSLPRWSPECDGMRVDVLTDLHTGSPHNGVDNLDRIVRRLVLSDADAVLLAGDYLILSVFLGTYVPPRSSPNASSP